MVMVKKTLTVLSRASSSKIYFLPLLFHRHSSFEVTTASISGGTLLCSHKIEYHVRAVLISH